jgi:hypothetical protein
MGRATANGKWTEDRAAETPGAAPPPPCEKSTTEPQRSGPFLQYAGHPSRVLKKARFGINRHATGSAPEFGSCHINGLQTCVSRGMAPKRRSTAFFSTLLEMRCGVAGREVSCWPPPESSTNINTNCCDLGLSDAQESDLVCFLETLTDG